MPEVSIITPCYNSARFLPETIQSVLNQTFTDWEWLIADDCSGDNSLEIIKKINGETFIYTYDKTGKLISKMPHQFPGMAAPAE